MPAATWEEMQDLGYVVHSPTTGRILPTQKSQSLGSIGSRLKSALGFRGGVRSGAFAGYQGPVQTRDRYGSPMPLQAFNHDVSTLSRAIHDPGDRAALGMLTVNLNNQHLRGLEGIDRERAGRVCAATSAIAQITTTIGSAVAANNAGGGSKDPVKGQGSSSNWETANNIAGQTDELCGALFAQSGSTAPANPFTPPGAPPVPQLPPPAQGGSFGSDGNKYLLYGAGAVALVGVLFLLKD